MWWEKRDTLAQKAQTSFGRRRCLFEQRRNDGKSVEARFFPRRQHWIEVGSPTRRLGAAGDGGCESLSNVGRTEMSRYRSHVIERSRYSGSTVQEEGRTSVREASNTTPMTRPAAVMVLPVRSRDHMPHDARILLTLSTKAAFPTPRPMVGAFCTSIWRLKVARKLFWSAGLRCGCHRTLQRDLHAGEQNGLPLRRSMRRQSSTSLGRSSSMMVRRGRNTCGDSMRRAVHFERLSIRV